jgi:hypothetical protein
LDIDDSLVEVHSEKKEEAAPTFKGGFGFHPLFCFEMGVTLAALLGPGKAGVNTVADHVSVLDAGPRSTAPNDRYGAPGRQRPRPRRARRRRADRLGRVHRGLLLSCRDRNVDFYVSARSNAVFDAVGIEEAWLSSLSQDGEEQDESALAELTSLIDRTTLPEGTRLVVRRQPPTPAPSAVSSSRSTTVTGASTPTRTAARERSMSPCGPTPMSNSTSAGVKDSDLTRLPFTGFEVNATWLTTAALAAAFVRWFQLLCCGGTWQDARHTHDCGTRTVFFTKHRFS